MCREQVSRRKIGLRKVYRMLWLQEEHTALSADDSAVASKETPNSTFRSERSIKRKTQELMNFVLENVFTNVQIL